MTTITQYTSDEAIELLTRNLGIPVKQSDLARMLKVSRQYIIQMKNKPLPVKYTEIIENKIKSQNVDDSITLDYYPQIFGSCGSGVFALSDEKQKLNVPKSAFMFNYSENKIYSVINAWGDSMNPFICNKDKLIVEHLNGEQIKDNHIYVFCYNNEIFVKRLIKNIDEVIIKSDNPDPIYRPRVIEGKKLSDLYIIGEIVGLIRNLR